MNRRNQKWLAMMGLGALVGIGLALGYRWGRSRPALTLPDGAKVEVRAVTYGTNHEVGNVLGRVLARLPGPLDRVLADRLGQSARVRGMVLPSPCLAVWLRLDRAKAVSDNLESADRLQMALAGEDGFVSGATANLEQGGDDELQFSIFPRRHKTLQLCFFGVDAKGQWHPVGRLPLANPLHRDYPQWQPERLPAVKRAGDLEVTLESFRTGHNDNSVRHPGRDGRTGVERGAPSDGRNDTVASTLIRPLRDTNEVWRVAGVELSDATGNQTRQTSLGQDEAGRSIRFSPSLWADEAAWRLRLELKKKSGFAAEELFVVKAVPLGELNTTNRLALSTNFGSVQVSLKHFFRLPPTTNRTGSGSSHLHLTGSNMSAGLQLDLVATRTDTGEDQGGGLWRKESRNPGTVEQTYSYRTVPATARTADFTFALHASRSVEFMVKPEVVPPARAE